MKFLKKNSSDFYLASFTLFTLFIFSHCGGGNNSSLNNNGENTPSPSISADSTTVTTTKNLILASMKTLTGDSSSGSLQLRSNLENNHEEPISNCTYNANEYSYTCQCLGGGSVKWTSQETISRIGEEETFTHSFTETFANCLMSSCEGVLKKVNGQATGTFTGRHQNGIWSGNFIHRTVEECAGITMDNVKVGFLMQGDYDSTREEEKRETVSGYICIDGQKMTFNSKSELEEHAHQEEICK